MKFFFNLFVNLANNEHLFCAGVANSGGVPSEQDIPGLPSQMLQDEGKRLWLNKGARGSEEAGEGRRGSIKQGVWGHLRSWRLYLEDNEKLCKEFR